MWESDRVSFLRLVVFGVLAHGLDLLTTYWRDPYLLHEGNPVYGWLQHFGLGGWAWVLGGKAFFVLAAASAHLWYLKRRTDLLPAEPQPCNWRAFSVFMYGQYVPFAQSLFRLPLKARDWHSIALALAAIALPASSVGALYYSLENADGALHPGAPLIPYAVQTPMACVVGVLGLAWFVWAWLRYYRQVLLHAARPDAGDAPSASGDG